MMLCFPNMLCFLWEWSSHVAVGGQHFALRFTSCRSLLESLRCNFGSSPPTEAETAEKVQTLEAKQRFVHELCAQAGGLARGRGSSFQGIQ